MFNNKKIFILGMARSGYESAKVLANHGCDVTVSDMKEQDENQVRELENLGVKIVITNDPVGLIDESFDFIVKNPGIRLDHPVCEKAKELNIKVISMFAFSTENWKRSKEIYEILRSWYSCSNFYHCSQPNCAKVTLTNDGYSICRCR